MSIRLDQIHLEIPTYKYIYIYIYIYIHIACLCLPNFDYMLVCFFPRHCCFSDLKKMRLDIWHRAVPFSARELRAETNSWKNGWCQYQINRRLSWSLHTVHGINQAHLQSCLELQFFLFRRVIQIMSDIKMSNSEFGRLGKFRPCDMWDLYTCVRCVHF